MFGLFVGFARNCDKYKLDMLLTDLDYEALNEIENNSAEPRYDAMTLKNEVYDLMKDKQRLRFYGIYLEKYQNDVAERIEYLDGRISLIEKNYAALVEKEEAEENLMATLGGTRLEGNQKIAKVLNVVNEFGGYRCDKRLASKVRGN